MGEPSRKPSYLALTDDEITDRIRKAEEMLSPCRVCPRDCGPNRLKDEEGFCRTGRNAFLSSFNPHFGEEKPLVGRGGSGTIFISRCNLRCVFCQNYEISQLGEGEKVPSEKISSVMLYLQRLGCENINFVSPSHVVPQILASLPRAIERGLHLPLVYNTGGYDSLETLRLLDGIFDIYMPDMKYASNETAKTLSGVGDYVERNREAVGEMHRQVGDLLLDERGVAIRGLLVRHLVLPADLAGTADVTAFIAKEISEGTYINVMDQYRPCYRAEEFPDLSRRITRQEYRYAMDAARGSGLHRFDSPGRHHLLALP